MPSNQRLSECPKIVAEHARDYPTDRGSVSYSLEK